jgi:hypothetical protein
MSDILVVPEHFFSFLTQAKLIIVLGKTKHLLVT